MRHINSECSCISCKLKRGECKGVFSPSYGKPKLTETKLKISNTLKNKFKTGELVCPWKGVPRRKEHSMKISISHKDKHYSTRTEFKKGNIPIHMKNPDVVKKIQEKRMLKINEIGEKISKACIGKNNGHFGQNHYNWQGGKSFEIYPIEFSLAKKIVRNLYKNTCQLCFGNGLTVHHIDYDKSNNKFSNLICLCTSCHSKTNYDKNRWINYFKSLKYVLVTGSEGMFGKELIEQLLVNKKIRIKYADIKLRIDLTDYNMCEKICNGINECYSLVGVKGSPRMTKEKPVDFMVPMLRFDTNMIYAAQLQGVKKFLYTSSIAVENPQTDMYPAWAKMTAEKLVEAMRIQYPKGTKYCIVRPANGYGKYDNFDNPDAMVITSLFKKALTDSKILVWGDGSQIRDFVHAKDVARGMIEAMKKMPKHPINLCSGKGVMIKKVAMIIGKLSDKEVVYHTGMKFTGDKKRVMKRNGFAPKIDINEGLEEVWQWIKKP